MEDKEMMGNSTGQRVGGSPQSIAEGIPDDLQRLEILDDWEIAEGETDPRGFEFVGVDKEKIGTIDSLLASPSTQRAHIVIVDPEGTGTEGRYNVTPERIKFRDGKAYRTFTRAPLLGGPAWADGERDLSR